MERWKPLECGKRLQFYSICDKQYFIFIIPLEFDKNSKIQVNVNYRPRNNTLSHRKWNKKKAQKNTATMNPNENQLYAMPKRFLTRWMVSSSVAIVSSCLFGSICAILQSFARFAASVQANQQQLQLQQQHQHHGYQLINES